MSNIILTRNQIVLALECIYNGQLRLVRGQKLAVAALRRLIKACTGEEHPTLKQIEQHRPVASLWVWLDAAGLFTTVQSCGRIDLTQLGYEWLHTDPLTQREMLRLALADDHRWEAAVARWRCGSLLDIAQRHYLQQQIEQIRLAPCPKQRPTLHSLPNLWCLTCAEIETDLLFHLLPCGLWNHETGELYLTAETMQRAKAAGTPLYVIRHRLETALGGGLRPEVDADLGRWYDAGKTVTLAQHTVLTAPNPTALRHLLRHKRLWGRGVRPFSRRHALVPPREIEAVVRAARAHGLQLTKAVDRATVNRPEPSDGVDRFAAALGLRLAAGLGELVPLPYPAPHEAARAAAERLSPEAQSELNRLVRETLEGVQQAIAGRDAFFPAVEPPSETLVAALEEALAADKLIQINYQALGERVPKWRLIEPLCLTRRGALAYVEGYCYRAERNLTFRLDRIVAIDWPDH